MFNCIFVFNQWLYLLQAGTVAPSAPPPLWGPTGSFGTYLLDPIHEEILGLHDEDVPEKELEERYKISVWMKVTGALSRETEQQHIEAMKAEGVLY